MFGLAVNEAAVDPPVVVVTALVVVVTTGLWDVEVLEVAVVGPAPPGWH